MNVGLTNGMVLAGAAILSTLVIRIWLARRRRARILAITREVTRRHARLLSVKQQQLVVHDGYGNYQLQPWIDHVDYFIEHVVLREIGRRGLRVEALRRSTAGRSDITRTLLATLHAGREQDSAEIRDDNILSGQHYETLCRNLLESAGWNVIGTPPTGDQGADLIADAAGRRVIIQCKFYGRPVGNKAVQEAHAGLGFHGGDVAAVVTNASFTRSAMSLARANRVLLMHHDQIGDLGRMIDAMG